MHKRSHNQVIRIEICDIYLYSKYVHVMIPLGGVGIWLALEWQLRVLLWDSFSFLLFIPSPLPPFIISLLFPFPIHARSATSMLKHFSSQYTEHILSSHVYNLS